MTKTQFLKWLNKKQYFHFLCKDGSIAIHCDHHNENAKDNLIAHIKSVTEYVWLDSTNYTDCIVVML